MHEYLLSYAKHFNLEPHFRLNVQIEQVTFDDDRQQWTIKIEGEDDKFFDKVLVAIGGVVGQPNMPSIPGLDKFAGQSIHARSFKRPSDFSNKRVMVVGFGNSAADTCTQLVGHSSKIYLSHRHGAHILPRMLNGSPIDHAHSLRLFNLQCLILKHFPHAGERFFNNFVKSLQDKRFTLRPEWGFEPAQKVPIVSDSLVDYLESGAIESTKGVRDILDTNTVELDDGRQLAVDVIIWCTGYTSDFSIIDARYDPTAPPTAAWSAAQGANGKDMFELWQNVFSTHKPESLAFVGNVHFTAGGFQIFDMAAMAVAQVWKGNSKLPGREQMKREVSMHHAWLADLAARGYNVSPANVDAGPWMRAMDELGGMGVSEYLGYGWKGWWFWVRNMRFCNLMMGGIWSPCIYRVFDGKREKWGGAKEAIESVNARKRETMKAK